MSELIKRLQSETPKFFKGVRKFGYYLMGVSAGIALAPDNIHIPELVEAISGYLATAGFIMSTVATFAKVDKP